MQYLPLILLLLNGFSISAKAWASEGDLCTAESREQDSRSNPDYLFLRGFMDYEDFCYSVKIPEGLIASTSRSLPGRGFSAFSRDDNHRYLSLVANPNSVEFASLDEIIQWYATLWVKKASEPSSVKVESLHLGGLDARRLTMKYRCSDRTEDFSLEFIVATLPNLEFIFEFTNYGLESSSKKLQPLIDSLLGSFRVNRHSPRCRDK